MLTNLNVETTFNKHKYNWKSSTNIRINPKCYKPESIFCTLR